MGSHTQYHVRISGLQTAGTMCALQCVENTAIRLRWNVVMDHVSQRYNVDD